MSVMIFSDPKKGLSFLHTTVELGLLWFGAVKLCEYAWHYFEIQSPPLVWAYSAATAFAVFYLLVFFCLSRQIVYQQRIDEMAEAKKKLEEQVIKRRQSSGNKKR